MGQRLFLFAVVLLLFVSAASSETLLPNTTTPLGPGFHLDTINGRFINPCWFVGITGGSLPAVQSLDLSDPMAPRLSSTLDGAGSGVQEFKLYMAMADPNSPTSPQFTFDVPNTGLDTNGNFQWTASYGGGSAFFTALFHIDAGDGSVIRWSASTPTTDSGRTVFEIDFDVDPGVAQDPILTFSLNERADNQVSTLSFIPEPTPEPESLGLLALGLVPLAGFSIRQR